jgi:hypothetical protein
MGLGSGIRKKPISDPGSRIQGQKGTGSRIPDPDPQHCAPLTFEIAARTHVVVAVSDIQLMSRLVREYVPLDQGRRRLAASAVSPPLIAAPEDGFLVFANSAGHRLLVFALLINFDENKLGEKSKTDGVFRIRYYLSGNGSGSVPISRLPGY